MKKFWILFLFFGSLVAVFQAFASNNHKSPYVGQHQRAIKSLSVEDIAELKKGSGWGLAKAAELNGMPGPVHLLELQAEISLTSDQINAIGVKYKAMSKRAVELGALLISLEEKLDQRFQKKTITDEELKSILKEISVVHSDLRYTHLSAHLEMEMILTPDQIRRYNQLRGYMDNNSCEQIPAGHDAALWRKHNGCP